MAATLALAWHKLEFDANGVSPRFRDLVASPIHKVASTTIDAGAIIGGVLLPGSVSQRVIRAYRRHLFGNATLQDLPDKPRFVINATNVQTGVLWRFSKPYMADYRVGHVDNPTTSLAVAVAASSAFPPFLSPVIMKLKPGEVKSYPKSDLHQEPYTTRVMLTDGGVYDNLGLETVWKSHQTVLVSDGGGQMGGVPKPHKDWARHFKRVNEVIDNQVRSLRKKQVVGSFVDEKRKGAFWRTRSKVANYPSGTPLSCPPERTLDLAETETRLKRMDPTRQQRLVNWGYAICDVAMRSHVDKDKELPEPTAFPYDAVGV